MTEYNDQDREDLAPWLEMAALRAENERLAAELSKASEAPGTEAGGGEPAAGETPAALSHDEITAAVDEIPLSQTTDRFYEQLSAVPGAVNRGPATQPTEQLAGEELAAALDKAASEATNPDEFYAALSELPGALDNSGGRVIQR